MWRIKKKISMTSYGTNVLAENSIVFSINQNSKAASRKSGFVRAKTGSQTSNKKNETWLWNRKWSRSRTPGERILYNRVIAVACRESVRYCWKPVICPCHLLIPDSRLPDVCSCVRMIVCHLSLLELYRSRFFLFTRLPILYIVSLKPSKLV